MKKVSSYIKYLVVIVMAVVLQACGSSKNVLAAGEVKSDMSARTIVRNHYKNELDFSTIRGKMKIDFDNGDDSKSFSVSFRMKKDSTILLTATLGVVKALITPTRVSFYNKLDGTYFDGDFAYLSKYVGIDLDFQKVQNLLLGQAIYDLHDDKFYASIVDNNYQLKPENANALLKTLYLIEPSNFKMALQQLAQPQKDRMLNINYNSYQKVGDRVLPNKIVVTATDKGVENKIEISYNNVEFDGSMNFPYHIPSGYEEIKLND
ncbi:DUF4292 domain-containing protein [Zhouia sp. PK063]|uniref:DUF4292 domain-containing protein n=1 Tax=Zhouia sp. PK063 TaxID=3373602 RepID=UPI0037886B47